MTINSREFKKETETSLKSVMTEHHRTQVTLFSFIFAFCWYNITYEFISFNSLDNLVFFFFFFLGTPVHEHQSSTILSNKWNDV